MVLEFAKKQNVGPGVFSPPAVNRTVAEIDDVYDDCDTDEPKSKPNNVDLTNGKCQYKEC